MAWGNDIIQNKVLECIAAEKRYRELNEELRTHTDGRFAFCDADYRLQMHKGLEQAAKYFQKDIKVEPMFTSEGKPYHRYSFEILGMEVFQLEGQI